MQKSLQEAAQPKVIQSEAAAPTDGVLFAKAMQGVKPLASPNKVRHTPQTPNAGGQKKPTMENYNPSIGLSDHISDLAAMQADYVRHDIKPQQLKRLRKGLFTIQHSVDLHHYTTDTARTLVVYALDKACAQGLNCICIIHGQGFGSKNGQAVLKYTVRSWLQQYPDVLAYCDAPPIMGGQGATLVLLSTRRAILDASS